MDSLPSSIRPVARESSLRDAIEESVALAIASGEFAPGTLVSVPALAAQFGVSATPVREAMINLEQRNFVQPVRNKGFRVTEVSDEDLWNLVQLRRWLESPAMRIVANRIKSESVEELRILADELSDAAEKSDFRRYLSADAAFHDTLIAIAGNKRLSSLVTDLRRETRMVGLVAMSNSVELKISANEHHQLLDLLVEGNGLEAERLMNTHIGHVVGWWAGIGEGTRY